MRIVVFGPGPRFKGGIANFTISLCNALINEGHEVHLVSWSQQFPFFIPRNFKDEKSNQDAFLNNNLIIHYITNFNNPLTWRKTARLIQNINPDHLIVQWALSIQGLPIGYILKKVKRKTNINIIIDCHNLIQKENSILDHYLTKLAFSNFDQVIVHGQQTINELYQFFPKVNWIESRSQIANDTKLLTRSFHPTYDIYKANRDFNVEAFKKQLGLNQHVFLFFGFIRKYKGLHQAIPAFADVLKTHNNVSLLIVGESFWEKESKKGIAKSLKKMLFNTVKAAFIKSKDNDKDYNPLALIETLDIEKSCVVINEFVANEEVYKYFLSADAVLLFYEYATPSGVESIAWNFGIPVLASNTAHFQYSVIEGENGYLAQNGNINSMTESMIRIIDAPISTQMVKKTAQRFTWAEYVKRIFN